MVKDLGGNIEDVQGLICKLAPEGYVYNILTGELEFRGIHQRSPLKEEQYWEPYKLPADFQKLREKEILKQQTDPDYFDQNLEAIRAQEWDRRLNGFWFYNNGKATYITGMHYFYMTYWMIDVGLPKYRETDRKFFYFLQYCVEDPECLGMIEITKRRQGKTFRGGVFLYEYTSRVKNARSGIQSKTAPDAKEVFRKAVIQPFKKLPDFFVPVYDQSKGLTPTSELRFFHTTVRGKNAAQIKGGDELESMIDWKASEAISYDGQKLHRLLTDEAGKTADVNVWDRHLVTKYCLLDDEGNIIGKNLVTSTVEEMESGGAAFKKMWDASDHVNKEGKRTPSGLYRYFCSAADTRYYDKFGYGDRDRAMEDILAERSLLKSDTRALSAIIRKEPITSEEAFRVDGDKCLYNSFMLNERLDVLSWKENLTTKGDFVWKEGKRDTEVIFEPRANGKWEVIYLFDDEKKANKVIKRGEAYYPGNKGFVIGVDPFDHVKAQDGRMSNGAIVVRKKWSPIETEYNGAFIAKYCFRPDTPQIFYEEVIKAGFYFGCDILFENNKIGLQHYMQDRGYYNFLMWLPDRLQPGIAASPKTTQYIAEITDTYINEYINEVYFKDLITDWLSFSVENTTKFDLAMACGYALIADQVKVVKEKKEDDFIPVNQVFRQFKINR